MITATLAVMTRGNKILLGLKKGDPEIGKNKLSAPGGKLELGETLVECLVREVKEEVRIVLEPTKVEKCAIIIFYAAGVADFEVHMYRTNDFRGEPRTTKEMIPEWHHSNDIPFRRMLPSDVYWLPPLIRGEMFYGKVYFKKRGEGLLGIKLFPVKSFPSV
jgi:8-oxo-dGTP diphosphatase